MKHQTEKQVTGRHVLYGLLCFFGVMLIANSIFLYYAIGTFNGFETKDAYKRGLNYNVRIAADAAQNARGWKAVAEHNGSTGEFVLQVRDRSGSKLAGLTISGELRRPVTDRHDRLISFRETAPAHYAAPAKLAAGQWVLMVEVREPGSHGEPAFRFKKRMWIKDTP
ncbi:MAG: FixH family protein [Hyphomicrobiaceae bacterium]|nr:FixH family protein [Hyphomicrobiaceae bacterium]